MRGSAPVKSGLVEHVEGPELVTTLAQPDGSVIATHPHDIGAKEAMRRAWSGAERAKRYREKNRERVLGRDRKRKWEMRHGDQGSG